MQINAMIFFDAPFRGRHVIPLLGVDQTTSLLVVLIITLVLKAAKQPLTTARSAGEIKA